MPVDYYPNLSVEELQQRLTELQRRGLRGQITEVTAAGVRTVRTPVSGGTRNETEVLRVLYSLYRRDPESFSNPYAERIRRTGASYR